MGEMKGIRIISTGSTVGSRMVANDEIAEAAGTTDEWIVERTGIHQRHYCDAEESNTDMAIAAAKQALERSGLDAEKIGLCVVATMTPDFATPSTACLVQEALGLREDIASYDINAACSGFLYALDAARAQMYMNDIEYALLIGSERFSDILDMTDYGTAIIFGDGAGAVIIGKSDSMFYSLTGSQGSKVIWAKGPGSEPTILHMQGRPVFKFATTTIEKSIKTILEKAGLTLNDVDHFIFHQANERIIDFVIRRMKLDASKVYKNISGNGNTSAASIPLLLDEVVTAGHIKKGDKVLSVGFGGGLTWAAALLEW
jgi:3-oxoacyl-[acyl-carrier-protein] synthase-3